MSDAVLRLADDLLLPASAATEKIAILGITGAGKTHTACVIVEELVAARQQVVVLDPSGALWGLRAGRDGSGDGLPIAILGGEHADVPLEPDGGELVADFVVDARASVLLDLSEMRKGEQGRFVTAFAERLYHRKARQEHRTPLHVIIDEADLFAPQRPMRGQERMLGAVEDLVRRGRARGIGVTLATQRPAVLNKDATTQCGTLVVLRMIGPQDVAAIEAWIKYHGTAEGRTDVLGTLSSLAVGEAWVWSPGWLKILRRVRLRQRRTYDSGKTPTGSGGAPIRLGAVDLDALRASMEEVVARARQDDPADLRRRIVELEERLGREERCAEPVRPVRVEVPWIPGEVADVVTAAGELAGAIESLRRVLERPPPERAVGTVESAAAIPVDEAPPRARASRSASAPRSPRGEKHRNGALGRCERAILARLAVAPSGRLDRVRIGIRTGYAHAGGGFLNALGALRSRGLVEKVDGGFALTSAGIAAAVTTGARVSAAMLLDDWCTRLTGRQRDMLRFLTSRRRATREQIAHEVGMEPKGGGFLNYLGELRSLGLVRRDGGNFVVHEDLVGAP